MSNYYRRKLPDWDNDYATGSGTDADPSNDYDSSSSCENESEGDNPMEVENVVAQEVVASPSLASVAFPSASVASPSVSVAFPSTAPAVNQQEAFDLLDDGAMGDTETELEEEEEENVDKEEAGVDEDGFDLAEGERDTEKPGIFQLSQELTLALPLDPPASNVGWSGLTLEEERLVCKELHLPLPLKANFPPLWEPVRVDDDIHPKNSADVAAWLKKLCLCTVASDTEEFRRVEKLLKNGVPDARLTKLERVYNRGLWLKYSSKRQEILRNCGTAGERRLWHGTRSADPYIIITHAEGFAPKYGASGLYGRGVYFAAKADYPDIGFVHRTKSGQKQLFLVLVACGRTCTYGEATDPTLVDAPLIEQPVGGGLKAQERYDAVHGSPPEQNVDMFIVYQGYQAFPEYLLTYR